jgi:hypothetical protein
VLDELPRPVMARLMDIAELRRQKRGDRKTSFNGIPDVIGWRGLATTFTEREQSGGVMPTRRDILSRNAAFPRALLFRTNIVSTHEMAAHGLISTWRAVKALMHRRASPSAVRHVIKPMKGSTCVSHLTQHERPARIYSQAATGWTRGPTSASAN